MPLNIDWQQILLHVLNLALLVAGLYVLLYKDVYKRQLLYGDAGTGKSTSVKALLNEYADRGLRMIEIYKHQFGLLSQVIAQVKKRNYRFMICLLYTSRCV